MKIQFYVMVTIFLSTFSIDFVLCVKIINNKEQFYKIHNIEAAVDLIKANLKITKLHCL